MCYLFVLIYFCRELFYRERENAFLHPAWFDFFLVYYYSLFLFRRTEPVGRPFSFRPADGAFAFSQRAECVRRRLMIVCGQTEKRWVCALIPFYPEECIKHVSASISRGKRARAHSSNGRLKRSDASENRSTQMRSFKSFLSFPR